MIRVVLIDDHPFVRTGIRNILQNTTDITVVGEAGDGYQALQLIDELDPDVLVLDMEMPGLKGYEVANKLNEIGSDLPVIALSAHEDKQYILGMLSQGAYGYLTKDEVPEMIVRAVRGVASGQRGWISRRVAARIAMWLQGEKQDQIKLNSQDIQMLRMLLIGNTNEQIGVALDMDSGEVENRLERTVQSIRSSLENLL